MKRRSVLARYECLALRTNALPVFDDLHGDAKGSEPLAWAARHDETPPVVVGKPGDGVPNPVRLKGPRHLRQALRILFLDLNSRCCRKSICLLSGLAFWIALRIRSPSARRHGPSQTECRLLRSAEELVHTSLAERMQLVEVLACLCRPAQPHQCLNNWSEIRSESFDLPEARWVSLLDRSAGAIKARNDELLAVLQRRFVRNNPRHCHR